ncbi:MAG: PTS transporter subunit EIIC [Erysipelotrichaceae bacterium]|nr:PTS transporter subunit EIIC [Erysipelotrichaceae bacterium]
MKHVLQEIYKKVGLVFSTMIDCIVPTLPIMIGVGMLKVALIIAGPLVLNLISESSDTYAVLSFVADAGYYFMPIYIAVSSADVFKVDRFLSAVIGAMLLSPAFVRFVEEGKKLSVFGLPIASTSYGNQVISSIIAIWLMSYIYHFLEKKLPGNLKPILLPLLSIVIMVPVTFCAIGPIGVFLGDRLVDLIMKLKDLGPIGNGIMCAIIPFITIGGLGGANLSAMLLLASTGVDPILFFANVLYNNILGFVTMALYLKDRKSETLAAAITAALGGTSEPALFGIVMKDYKALSILSISGFFAGFYAGLMKVKSYAMASFGTFGIVTTIGPDSSILHAAIAMVIGCALGFVLTYLTHRNDQQKTAA